MAVTVDFGEPIGEAETIYTMHSEMRTFGRSFGCREASFRLCLRPSCWTTLRELTEAPEDEVARKADEALPPSASTVSVHLVEASGDGARGAGPGGDRADGGVGARRRRRLHGSAGRRRGAAARPRARSTRAARCRPSAASTPRTCSPSSSREDVGSRSPGSRGGRILKVGVPTEIKPDEYRVALTPVGRAGAGRARPRGADPEGRRRGQRDHATPTTRPRARGSSRPPRTCSAEADLVLERQGAPAAGGRAASPGHDPVHLPAPRPGAGADPGPVRVGRHLRRLRDRRGRRGPAAAARADERDRGQDRHPGGRVHAREAARRPRHPARRRARRRRRRT